MIKAGANQCMGAMSMFVLIKKFKIFRVFRNFWSFLLAYFGIPAKPLKKQLKRMFKLKFINYQSDLVVESIIRQLAM